MISAWYLHAFLLYSFMSMLTFDHFNHEAIPIYNIYVEFFKNFHNCVSSFL